MTGYFGSTYFGQYWPGTGQAVLELGRVQAQGEPYGIGLSGSGAATLSLNDIPSSWVVRGIDLANIGQLLLGKITNQHDLYGPTLSGTGSASLSIGKIASAAVAYAVCLYHSVTGTAAAEATTLALASDEEDTITLATISEATVLETAAVEVTTIALTGEGTEDTLTITPAPDGTC